MYICIYIYVCIHIYVYMYICIYICSKIHQEANSWNVNFRGGLPAASVEELINIIRIRIECVSPGD